MPGTVSLVVKRLGLEADHSPPSIGKVKNGWSYTSSLPISLHGVVLNYEMDISSQRLTLLSTGRTLHYFTYYTRRCTFNCVYF